MRVCVPASALRSCLVPLVYLMPLAMSLAMASAAVPTPAPPATPSAAAPAAPATDMPDAAVKHAKRTGCLKEARTKKLVGAAKTAYIKGCVAAP